MKHERLLHKSAPSILDGAVSSFDAGNNYTSENQMNLAVENTVHTAGGKN